MSHQSPKNQPPGIQNSTENFTIDNPKDVKALLLEIQSLTVRSLKNGGLEDDPASYWVGFGNFSDSMLNFGGVSRIDPPKKLLGT